MYTYSCDPSLTLQRTTLVAKDVSAYRENSCSLLARENLKTLRCLLLLTGIKGKRCEYLLRDRDSKRSRTVAREHIWPGTWGWSCCTCWWTDLELRRSRWPALRSERTLYCLNWLNRCTMGTCVQTERHLFSFDEENEEELGGEDERGYTSEGN